MTPDELASELSISAKVLRSWLRTTHPRSDAEKYQRWELDDARIAAAREHFGSL